jgi:monoterpene epsilon-lactone hydrolase
MGFQKPGLSTNGGYPQYPQRHATAVENYNGAGVFQMDCRRTIIVLLGSAMLLPILAVAQADSVATTAETAAKGNSSYIDAEGNAHVTRVVPVPKTISAEAQAMLGRPSSDAASSPSIAEQRAWIDSWQKSAGEVSRRLYPAEVAEGTMAGVPVRIVTPMQTPAGHQDRVLMNLHGGGFQVDSGSLTETIPIAGLTQTKVVAVLYRMAPEHPFPAAVDDAVAVYKELLKTYKPEHIAVYGTSAGAILTAEFAVKVKQLGLPEPAALGVFSGLGDFSRTGDSWNLFSLNGLSGHLDAGVVTPKPTPYVGSTDVKDPVLSPVYADLSGLPPTLFITSTRDALLSGTALLDRAFLQAGVAAVRGTPACVLE